MAITTTLRHKQTVAVWMALALGFSSTAIQAQSSLTAGSFAVNDAGAATYSIPLVVAPAAGELAPKLSLQYSSQAANGVFGVGWTLSGVSSITRCAKTPAEEGDRIGVKNDASDVFCLDGQKLRATSGTYGAANTQYRTAIDTYGRITSQGNVAGGPQYFTLEAKTGEIYTFGGSDGSRLEHPSKGVVRTWMVSEIKDRFNNSIAFTYTKDLTLGEQLLTQVAYNNGQIKLNYEARPANDQILKYDDGIQYGSTNSRVSSITVAHKPLVSGTPTLTTFKTYQLQYTQSQASQRSMLKSIKECAADGACLPATTLSYRDGVPGSFRDVGAARFSMHSGLRDTEGNGKQSIYNFRGPDYTGTGYEDLAVWDVDGDGRTDLLTMTWRLGEFKNQLRDAQIIQYANGSQTSREWDYSNLILCFADINGDGKSEEIRRLRRAVGNHNNLYEAEAWDYSVSESWGNTSFDLTYSRIPPTGCRSVDIDGDGRAEVVLGFGSIPIYTLTYKNGSFSELPISQEMYSMEVRYGDFNGDGKTDGLVTSSFDSPVPASTILLSGAGLNGRTGWSTAPGGLACTGDFNGDGRTDILGGRNQLFLSNGISATTVRQDVIRKYISASFETPNSAICGDFNGDGLTDIAESGDRYWYNALPADVDRLIAVDNGGGFVHEVSYKSITDDSVYTKGSGAVYPQIDMQTPIMVVSHVRQSSNDPEKWQNTSYRYAALRADLQRSGTQGFGRVTSFNETSRINVATDYNQAYPLTGLRSQVRKFIGSEAAPQTLELTTYDYQTIASWVPGHTAVRLIRTTAEQYDLRNRGMRIGATSTSADWFDEYGFPRWERVEHFDGALNLTSRTISTHVYQHASTNWLLGQLVKTTTAVQNLRTLPSTIAAPDLPINPSPTETGSGVQLTFPSSPWMTPVIQLLLED